MLPLIDIVIPVHPSHQRYLPCALESVQHQTVGLDLLNVITIDGSSGTSKARNEGAGQGTAPFLLFLDADDVLVNTCVEGLMRGYEKNDVSYVYGDAYLLNRDNTHLKFETTKEYDRKLLLKKGLHLVTTLLERKAFESVGGFDEAFKGWEDWKFYLDLAVAGYCGAHIPTPTLIYRQSSSINRIKHDQLWESIRQETSDLYADYILETRHFMACGCKSSKNDMKNLLKNDGQVVQMEYVGRNQAPIKFMFRDRQFLHGARDGQNQYHYVTADQANELMTRWSNQWKVVGELSEAPTIPNIADLVRI